jgi:adenylate kinase
VDDATTVELVEERLAQRDVQKGYILDGFPSTIYQAGAFERFAHADKVVYISISDEDIMERLGGRLVCRNCGINFHATHHAPNKEGTCDRCDGELYTRDDDKEEAIHKRLDIYREQTAPLIDYYRGRGILAVMEARVKFEETLANFKEALACNTAAS